MNIIINFVTIMMDKGWVPCVVVSFPPPLYLPLSHSGTPPSYYKDTIYHDHDDYDDNYDYDDDDDKDANDDSRKEGR